VGITGYWFVIGKATRVRWSTELETDASEDTLPPLSIH
jgi:hypothetical protein